MSNVNIYVDSKVLSEPLNPLYFLYSKKIRSNFFVSSRFINIKNDNINVFTNVNKFVVNLIKKHKINNYMFILNSSIDIDIDKNILECLFLAKKIYFIGEKKNSFSSLNNISYMEVNNKKLTNSSKEKYTYEEFLSTVYSECMSDIGEKIYVLSNNDLNYWKGIFDKKGVQLIQLPISLGTYDYCAQNFCEIGKASLNEDTNLVDQVSVDDFTQLLKDDSEDFLDTVDLIKGINIVCFNPTYLFKDLVDRFVDMGCVHSDFPLPNYEGYIWMRPQEIWHLEYIKENIQHKEIPKRYFTEGLNVIDSIDFETVKSRSVAIHHGTCYEPLYQFDYNLLAKSLYHVKKVVGVCEFEECYGPSKDIANLENFKFVPIGYDSNLFKKALINTENKYAKKTINLGFVGRAYGTNDYALLAKSKMAEPKGYRKGGDILEAIANKLKVLNVDFNLHILGQNWEYLVEYFDQVGINYTYYARDKNITYKDYPDVYSKLDALLITARCEGGPVSAIEALSLGVPIISTNVGVVQFLDEAIDKGVNTFNYDKKWHIADISSAIDYLIDLYSSEITYEDRLEISRSVERYTTDNWVESIISAAKNNDFY